MAAFTQSDWTYYRILTIDNTKVAATMPDGGESGYPVDFIIDEANNVNWDATLSTFFAAYADAGDLCFTANPYGANTLPHGVKRIVTTVGSRYLAAAVYIPSIAGAVDTTIRMYYISALGDQQNKTGVYPVADNWAAYWPLEEDAGGVGAADLYKDWTSNAYDGDDQVSAIGKTGQVGLGQQFDGVDDYIDLGNILNALAYTITVMGLAYRAGGASQVIFFESDANAAAYAGLMCRINPLASGSINIGDNTGLLAADRRSKANTAITVAATTWTHCAFVVRGLVDMTIYFNGVDAGGAYSGTGGAMVQTADPAAIGKFSGGAGWTDGYKDEVSISTTERSANWIITTYNFQLPTNNNTFWTVGAEQSVLIGGHRRLASGGSLNYAASGQLMTGGPLNV